MKYPSLVSKLTTICDGWLVGSSAELNNDSPRDYDTIGYFEKQLMFNTKYEYDRELLHYSIKNNIL